MENIIDKLYAVIEERRDSPPKKSYVSSLFAAGMTKITDKVSEEAAEFIEAAFEDDRKHVIYEAADLLFHMLVLLGQCKIHPEEVLAELSRRFGISGIDEKEARKHGGGYADGQ